MRLAGVRADARRTWGAWRDGDISPAHVRVLSGFSAGHPRAGEHFADGEQMLVDHARRSRFDDFARVCAYWRDAAVPDGPEQRRGPRRSLCAGSRSTLASTASVMPTGT